MKDDILQPFLLNELERVENGLVLEKQKMLHLLHLMSQCYQ